MLKEQAKARYLASSDIIRKKFFNALESNSRRMRGINLLFGPTKRNACQRNHDVDEGGPEVEVRVGGEQSNHMCISK